MLAWNKSQVNDFFSYWAASINLVGWPSTWADQSVIIIITVSMMSITHNFSIVTFLLIRYNIIHVQRCDVLINMPFLGWCWRWCKHSLTHLMCANCILFYFLSMKDENNWLQFKIKCSLNRTMSEMVKFPSFCVPNSNFLCFHKIKVPFSFSIFFWSNILLAYEA